MFTVDQDYKIIDAHTPVLARQENGQFKPMDCYFLEFIVGPGDKNLGKIKALCEPFDYQYAINPLFRLFLLVNPDAIKNDFKEPDNLLALALCEDAQQITTIHYFEVNYKFRHSYDPNQKYRRVGTGAVKALQKFYSGQELSGRSTLESLEFWDKMRFTRIDGHNEQHLHWYQR